MRIYLGKDGRRRVWKTYPDGTKKIITYARHLMEEKLGRKLTSKETVDHIDRNKQNDNIQNLRIIDPNNHTREDNIRVKKIIITCILCGEKKEKEGRNINHNAKLGKAGPFCGRSCAGKYGARVQNGGERLPVQPTVSREYFYIEK